MTPKLTDDTENVFLYNNKPINPLVLSRKIILSSAWKNDSNFCWLIEFLLTSISYLLIPSNIRLFTSFNLLKISYNFFERWINFMNFLRPSTWVSFPIMRTSPQNANHGHISLHAINNFCLQSVTRWFWLRSLIKRFTLYKRKQWTH